MTKLKFIDDKGFTLKNMSLSQVQAIACLLRNTCLGSGLYEVAVLELLLALDKYEEKHMYHLELEDCSIDFEVNGNAVSDDLAIHLSHITD